AAPPWPSSTPPTAYWATISLRVEKRSRPLRRAERFLAIFPVVNQTPPPILAAFAFTEGRRGDERHNLDREHRSRCWLRPTVASLRPTNSRRTRRTACAHRNPAGVARGECPRTRPCSSSGFRR